MRTPRLAGGVLAAAAMLAFGAGTVLAQQPGTLRIAMTATDVPTTTGMPDNGFEGMRFLGYPVFESLVLWDLSNPQQVAGIRPGLAERYEQDANDPKVWRFHLRRGVTFHDGTAFNADAVIWNLDRFFRNDSPQFDATGSAITRGRIPVLESYRKVDDFTVELVTTRPVSYWPYLVTYILITSPNSWEQGGRDPARPAALLRTAHERLVDNPPWLWIVHDLNPRAMSRRVRNFTPAQSWFQDLTVVEVQ